MSFFKKTSFRQKTRPNARRDSSGDESTEGDYDDDNDILAGQTGTCNRQQRTKTKKGVFQRVFSFKRNTSSTQLLPAKHLDEDLIEIPHLEIAWETDLGLHHVENEDTAIVIKDLFAEVPQPEDSPWAQENLHKTLGKLLWEGNYDSRIAAALHHSFKQTENSFCDWAKANNITAGSCATCVIVKGDKIFCGNAGDSKAMVIKQLRKHIPKAAERCDLNERHGTQLKSERVRIKKAGGRIAPDGSVYGVLFPTRGFGDIDVKADGKQAVICTPSGAGLEGTEPYCLDRAATTYLIVASDGLWDFTSDKRVEELTMRHQIPGRIARELIKEARMGESEDDITVIVVRITFPSAQSNNSDTQLETVEE